MKKSADKKKRVLLTVFIVAAVICLAAAAYLLTRDAEAYKRQDTEESLAEEYINYLFDNAEAIEATEAAEDEMSNDETSEAETTAITETSLSDGKIILGGNTDLTETAPESLIHDDVYFNRNGITYTPDYAVGPQLFVLYFPDLGILRGVFGGNEEEIYKDLQWYWMACIGQPGLKLGETHMVIKAHNHMSQNLSFNQLPNAKEGEHFYLLNETGVYDYVVTDITIMSRSQVDALMYNMATDTKYCYLATCGRDYYIIDGVNSRYKDVVVVGELDSHKSLTEADRNILKSVN